MYKINNLTFKVNNNHHIPIPKNMNLFKTESDKCDYVYDIEVVDDIDVVEESFVIKKENIKIVNNGSLEKDIYIYKGILDHMLCVMR